MHEPIELKVHIAQDEETGRWYIAESEVPGLRVEAETVYELIRKIEDIAPELVELNAQEVIDGHVSRLLKSADRPPVNILPVFDSPLAVAC